MADGERLNATQGVRELCLLLLECRPKITPPASEKSDDDHDADQNAPHDFDLPLEPVRIRDASSFSLS